MNSFFVDASYWIALRDEQQAVHSHARRVMSRLFQQHSHFVTILPVVCEIHAFFSREQPKREQILRDLFNNPVVSLENILQQDQEAALEILQSHCDKSYSLCDTLSFVVMRRLKLKRALSLDNHFRQFGEFEIIPENFS